MLRKVVSQDLLLKWEPRSSPNDLRSVQVFLFRTRNDTIETHQWHLCLSGNFSLGSVRHGIKRRWISSGFAESVQHLLIESLLANDELVSVRLDLFFLISKFLEQSTVLRRHVICVANCGRHL